MKTKTKFNRLILLLALAFAVGSCKHSSLDPETGDDRVNGLGTDPKTGAASPATMATGQTAPFTGTVTLCGGSSVQPGDYWAMTAGGAGYYVWYTVQGAGADPAAGGTGICVDIAPPYADA